jgi:protein-S-isoprenylcysteine O-methyltransferase Ste14
MLSFEAKVWGQTVILPAFLLGLLLATAGTVAYWEAWLYCGLYFGGVAATTGWLLRHERQLLERRMKIGTVGESRPRQRWIMRLTLVLFLAFYIAIGLEYRWHGPVIPLPLVILGDLGLVLSFWIFHRVMVANRYASSVIEVTSDQPVIDTGPYAIVRHPMYAGALLLMAATPIALGTVWSLLAVIPLVLALALRLLDEEQMLSAELPGYRDYCRKTPYHLIPGIW